MLMGAILTLFNMNIYSVNSLIIDYSCYLELLIIYYCDANDRVG